MLLRFTIALVFMPVFACITQAADPVRWDRMISTEGQAAPIPASWISATEDQFAHSVRIPNPVPLDSGFKVWMTSEQYFQHLCRSEAGEFIYKTVERVKGLVQLRAVKRPTDDDLKSQYGLELPEISVVAYMGPSETLFVRTTRYDYFESGPNGWTAKYQTPGKLLRFSGYNEFQDKGMVATAVNSAESQFGYTWRGIRRVKDREHGIAGGEVIVLDLRSGEVIAVRRSYLRSIGIRNVPEGTWWLTSQMCSNFKTESFQDLSQQLYNFVSAVLKPVNASKQR